MKKTLIGLLMAGLVLAGCGVTNTTNNVATNAKSDVTFVNKANGVEVWIEAKNKVSAVDFTIVSDGGIKLSGFEPNTEMFSSALQNSGDETQWKVTVGIMKSTNQLPTGKLLIGKVMTTPGSGTLTIKSMKLVGPGAAGKSTSLLIDDIQTKVIIK